MVKYYLEYDGARHIRAYDTKNGVRPMGTLSQPNRVFIYHNSLSVSGLFDTVNDALHEWGEWSDKPVYLPGGTATTPIETFHPSLGNNILKPWHPGVKEIWPGESVS